jgi:hypothetical protein
MATLKKFGDAQDLAFGTATVTGFDIVESVSAESSYSTEITVKDKDGDTVGLVLGDERGSLTITGMADDKPTSMGAENPFSDPTGILGTGTVIVTGIRCTMSNEDFVKYETTCSVYEGITGTSS